MTRKGVWLLTDVQIWIMVPEPASSWRSAGTHRDGGKTRMVAFKVSECRFTGITCTAGSSLTHLKARLDPPALR